MNMLEIAHSCLMEILDEKRPFKLAIENTCAKSVILHEKRKELTSAIGCSLRHFYIFDNLISRLEKEFTKEQKALLYLYLSNRLFVAIFASKDFDDAFAKYDINENDIAKLDEISSDKTKLIPDNIPNDSIEYLHYRFNIPTWVLKMWMSHFKGYTFKIVKSINRPSNHYAIMSSEVENTEELLKKHPEIVQSDFEGLYHYNGNVPPARHSLFKERKMVLMTPAEHYLLEKLDLDVLRRVAIYSEINSRLHAQLIGLVNKRMKIDIIAGTAEAYYPAKKDIELANIVNTDIYEANHSSIITCLSENVHTFFVMPSNSNFAEFRKAPDYFNRVEQSSLDGLIANQLEALKSAAPFVEENGQLIYMVPTMDKKETIQIVEKFLQLHPNYVLVEQKQFLPFDKYDSTLFIAILRNEGSHD